MVRHALVRLTCVCAGLALLVGGRGPGPAVGAADPGAYDFVHDPSIIKQGATYYVFSTGAPDGAVGNGNIQMRTSRDLRHWRYRGVVFPTIPTWITDAVGPLLNLWAPDISYWRGVYHLYYAGSQFGTTNSVIGLATNVTLDPTNSAYHWVDRGLVVRSGSQDDWNAIDPTLALDAAGRPWLAFGSFWSGVKLRRVAPTTGKLATGSEATLYALASRPDSHAVEAPSILYRRPYYYLFVSFDLCCRGADSTYRIMVGRATRITGPYVARDGQAMSAGGATPVLASQGRYRGPGGQSVLRDGPRDLLAHHYYDAATGAARLQINPLTWSADGWPHAGPPLTP